jgi:hypothetical protein
MDPDHLLDDMRAELRTVRNAYQDDAVTAALSLADYFEMLDNWLSNGGFKPLAWSRAY